MRTARTGTAQLTSTVATAAVQSIRDLLARLSTSRRYLFRIGELSSAELAARPPANTIRFPDGTRTLATVLAGQLKHQAHNVEAIRTALAEPH